MKKQAADGSMDRISELPQAILHHIFSFLSQDEAAQTSLLSKSWNYVWSTRPNIEFREKWFDGDKETFMSVLNKTLQGYHDQNLCVHEFLVEISRVDSEIVLLLEKWIPRVVLNMGVKKFSLYNYSKTAVYFDLPSVVFESKSLQKLYLYGCKLNPKPLDKVLFKHLKTLSLEQAYIADETFEKIISNCPLIEYVMLDRCEGLRTIKVNKHHKYLKDFQLKEVHDVSIEIDGPTLETFKIVCNVKWFHQHKYFPHLKSLYLYMVRLSSKSFDFFSCNFPCLEELDIHLCYGFKQFQLISRSIKHLSVCGTKEQSIKATIDAPNIVQFEYEGDIPRSLSFTTTFSEWKSKIYLISNHASSSSWFLKLYDLLKSLSQSEISLNLFQKYPPDLVVEPGVDDIYGDGLYKPVVVEHLHLSFSGESSSNSLSALIIGLFRVCRPRKIRQYWYENENIRCELHREQKQITEFLCKILPIDNREECRNDDHEIMRHSFWQQEIEEVSMEVFDQKGKKCDDPVFQGTSWLEFSVALLPKNQESWPEEIRFLLKWREIK